MKGRWVVQFLALYARQGRIGSCSVTQQLQWWQYSETAFIKANLAFSHECVSKYNMSCATCPSFLPHKSLNNLPTLKEHFPKHFLSQPFLSKRFI